MPIFIVYTYSTFRMSYAIDAPTKGLAEKFVDDALRKGAYPEELNQKHVSESVVDSTGPYSEDEYITAYDHMHDLRHHWSREQKLSNIIK